MAVEGSYDAWLPSFLFTLFFVLGGILDIWGDIMFVVDWNNGLCANEKLSIHVINAQKATLDEPKNIQHSQENIDKVRVLV